MAHPTNGPLEWSDAAQKKIDALVRRYSEKQAACLPLLHLAQAEFGPLTEPVMHKVAETLDIPYAHVYGVVTFYTMFHQAKVGENVLMVCTNVSCMLRGGYEILRYLEKKLGIDAGQTTADGKFTLIEEECLAACANAPMMICGPRYYLDLTPEKVDQALQELAREPQSEHID